MVKHNFYENAYAKINLSLSVTGINRQNMHLIESFIVFADVMDKISFKTAQHFSLTIKGKMSKYLDRKQNSIIKAIKNFEDIINEKICADIVLYKNLPIAAGLAGGSADAAAVIRILHKIYPKITKKKL